MSTENTPKASPYPLAALWIKATPATGYSDAVSIRRVEVVRAPLDGIALVNVREGGEVASRYVNVSELASTPERAAAMLADQLPALIARPLLSSVAGMTATSAALSTEAGR